MTELGKEVLKYILSKTTYDEELIPCSDVRENFKSFTNLKYNQAFNSLKKNGYICTRYIQADQKMYMYITDDGVDYLEKKEQEKVTQRKQFYRDLIITIIGVLLGNIDRIINFIVNLLTNLLNG